MLRIFITHAGWIGLAVGLASVSHAAGVPRFEATACAIADIADVRPRLRCGVVAVPRDHAHPNGPSFRLAVVVVGSATQPALADPVVYISGGPGGPLTVYAGYQARHPYAADRDLILIDQRGTGRSEPRMCPELQGALVDAGVAVLADGSAAALAASRAAHVACHAALVANGVDPDDFGTATTVEDFEWVRRALGVARWNVVGESYGTTVAMTLMARHPQSVRSAVLDSVNPPDAFFGMPWSARVAGAREDFFAWCATSPGCGAAGLDLSALYRAAVIRLGREARGEALHLTPSLFEAVIGRLVYYPSFYAALPQLVAAAARGSLGPVAGAMGRLLDGARRDGNEGAFVAVECRDRPRWREPAAEGASPLDLALLPPGVCAAWSAPGPEPEVPRDSPVPTLVLAGQFDPNIRPVQSRRVAEFLGRSARWLLFAGIGHNVRHFSPCAERLVAAFIDAPDRAVDGTCAAGGDAVSASPPPRP